MLQRWLKIQSIDCCGAAVRRKPLKQSATVVPIQRRRVPR